LLPERVGASADWDNARPNLNTTFGLRLDGSMWQWGGWYDTSNADEMRSPFPTRVGNDSWTQVSGVYSHVCGLQPGGLLWCWGDNQYGTVGDGTSTDRASPVQVGVGSAWIRVVAGFTSCALKSDNTLWCWGQRWGNDNFSISRSPSPWFAAMHWRSLSEATPNCGVVTDGSLWCWAGRTHLFQSSSTSDIPKQIGAAADWENVASTEQNACAIRQDGSLWCWGANGDGQVGDGTTVVRPDPVRIGSGTWSQVSVAWRSACGVQRDGSLWCWGAATQGISENGFADVRVPTQVGADTSWFRVDHDDHTTCAVRTDHSLWCWGENSTGMAGDDSGFSTTPVVVR